MTYQSISGITRVEALAAVVSIGVIAAILFPAIQAARTTARREQRTNELKEVSHALQNSRDVYRRFPEPIRRDEVGRPLASWRYRLLPFIAAFMIEVDYDRPWFDPEAKHFSTRPMPTYCFPQAGEDEPLNTNVVAVVGPGTIFDESRDSGASQFDGQTILAIDVADFDRHWMEPGDLDIDDLSVSHMSGIDGRGLLAVFVDGSVVCFSKTTPVDEFKKYVMAGDIRGRNADLFNR